jgi:hypothetical protein
MRHRRRRTIALGAVLATMLALLLPAPAGAAGMTQISGTAVAGDATCTDPPAGFEDFALDLEGSLDGCWYIHVDGARYIEGSGVYLETGRERFVGCIAGGGCGTFDTTYRFTAKFADVDLTQEVHGRCQHPITAGTGTDGLTGVEGRVDFKDDVDTGTFHYRGHVRL